MNIVYWYYEISTQKVIYCGQTTNPMWMRNSQHLNNPNPTPFDSYYRQNQSNIDYHTVPISNALDLNDIEDYLISIKYNTLNPNGYNQKLNTVIPNNPSNIFASINAKNAHHQKLIQKATQYGL